MSLTPTQRKRARTLIRRYCERAEAAKVEIHYSQARPMTHLGVPPESGFTADCSGFATGAFYWADLYGPQGSRPQRASRLQRIRVHRHSARAQPQAQGSPSSPLLHRRHGAVRAVVQ